MHTPLATVRSWVPLALVLTACSTQSGGASVFGEAATAGAGGATGAGGSGSTSSLVLSSTTATGAGAGAGGTMECGNELGGVIRDFRDSHPDFEHVIATDKGIVEAELGADGKPVYAGNPTTPTTNGAAAFDQWFRDVEGVNLPIAHAVTLVEGEAGVFTFASDEFFPIDDQGFGNEGRDHNFHFTYEIHTELTYEGGEVFTFSGDDDVFVFVNGRLALDLGGVHGEQTETIDLDARAGELDIAVGSVYPLDFFFAERHTSQSNFRIDTTITCFTTVEPPQ